MKTFTLTYSLLPLLLAACVNGYLYESDDESLSARDTYLQGYLHGLEATGLSRREAAYLLARDGTKVSAPGGQVAGGQVATPKPKKKLSANRQRKKDHKDAVKAEMKTIHGPGDDKKGDYIIANANAHGDAGRKDKTAKAAQAYSNYLGRRGLSFDDLEDDLWY